MWINSDSWVLSADRWESHLGHSKNVKALHPSPCLCVRWESWWVRSFSCGALADKGVAAKHYLCHHVFSLFPTSIVSLPLALHPSFTIHRVIKVLVYCNNTIMLSYYALQCNLAVKAKLEENAWCVLWVCTLFLSLSKCIIIIWQ